MHKTIMDNTQPRPKTDEIKCPDCGALIPISETLRHQLTEETRSELQKELLQQRQKLSSKEKSLQEKEKELASAQENIDKSVQEKLGKERGKLQEEALRKAREDQGVELKNLQAELEEGREKVKKAQERELELLKKEREVEESRKSIALQLAKKLEVEKKKI